MSVVTANQPRFFPFIPYWKYAVAGDIFDVGIHDPFTVKHHHRVTLGNDSISGWVRLPLKGKANDLVGVPMSEIQIKESEFYAIGDKISDYHRKDQYWGEVGKTIVDVAMCYESNLADYLVSTMKKTAVLLDLPINFVMGVKDDKSGTVTERVASQLKIYKDSSYLAGAKSKEYLDVNLYSKITGQKVEFFKPSMDGMYPYSTVSIISVLCNLGKEKTRNLILGGL